MSLPEHKPAATFRLLCGEGKPIPVLTQEDLIAYDWPTHTMILKPGVVGRLFESLISSLARGFPLEVEANGVTCYGAILTTSGSSFSQSCAVIDVYAVSKDRMRWETELSITLGYPTEEFFKGNDPRADPRIREALNALGKLKDNDIATQNQQ